jgi:hypothetical protein
MPTPPTTELFELSLLGGAPERRYRKLRPEVDSLPWDSLKPEGYSPELVAAARRTWTEAAFQEHRTGAACAATLQALIAARAPLDLIGMASRFPLDEMVHVEMCARLAEALGGGVPLEHDPQELLRPPGKELPVLLRATELVVRNFCVGEALSIPLLHASWRAATHPLIRGVLGRIVKDEAAHGQFGWMYLDWVADELTPEDRQHLAGVATSTIDAVVARWKQLVPEATPSTQAHPSLGWMEPPRYLELAHRSLHQNVLAPLRARGIDPGPYA